MADEAQREWDRSAYISIRRQRDALLRPVSGLLARLGISASAISLLGVTLAAGACWSADRATAWAFVAFLGALACDALDGAVARHRGTDSSAGKVVDHACDAATFLLVLLAIVRCDLSSTWQISVSALLAVPILVVAIHARRRRSEAHLEPSGGFLAHVYKVPIYGAFLLYAGGGANLLEGAVKLANMTAMLSLILLLGAMLRPRRTAGTHAVTETRS